MPSVAPLTVAFRVLYAKGKLEAFEDECKRIDSDDDLPATGVVNSSWSRKAGS